ncbi:hypothetical protein [Rhizobium leguminosarum]|uniref:hypothetical protein n=1 Tax=Rhizobium leguminosarum TaxID=384 RepID=UPI00103BD223|nr:hypothetical protein [Rhizobium leguminosarum]TCA01027.1 hypothetical protein E0H68_37345 [Rhizobium leguminosarum bv. viciae]TCA13783.1 hypothetical protein E0H67_37530 [Rhizobium leguminosarum bv. viciae]
MNDARGYLIQNGIIPLSPTKGLVSIVDLILGPGVPGNWWGHQNANLAYNAYSELANDPDIIVMKLVDYKVTLVHRTLWDCIFRVALDNGRITWRKKSLSPQGLLLLNQIEKIGSISLDFITADLQVHRKTITKERRKLEEFGLVVSREEHTSSGHHDIVLESWKSAAKTRRVAPPASLTVVVAHREIQSRIGRHKSSLALP